MMGEGQGAVGYNRYVEFFWDNLSIIKKTLELEDIGWVGKYEKKEDNKEMDNRNQGKTGTYSASGQVVLP